MTVLDITTLHVVISCLLISMAGVMWFMRRIHPNETALSMWAISNIFCAVGVSLGLLQIEELNFSSVILANLLMMAGASTFWVGLRIFLGLPPRWPLLITMLCVFTAIETHFLYIMPLTWARLANESIFITLISILTVINLIPPLSKNRNFTNYFITTIYSVHSFAIFFRAYYAIKEKPTLLYFELKDIIPVVTGIDALIVIFACNACFLLLVSERLQQKLINLATIDELTGLFNRRAFNRMSEEQIARSKRREEEISILLMDLDNFKMINDQYGHHAGDLILKEFSSVVQKNTRHGDIIGRVGGEEFCILLSATDAMQAFHIADRIRLAFAQSAVLTQGIHISTTLSIGIAVLAMDEPLEKAIRRSDRALYAAKNAGRNRVYIEIEEIPSNEDQQGALLEWDLPDLKIARRAVG